MEATPDVIETGAPAPAARRCDNCGAQLLGEHCFACGQPTKGLVRHFGSILGDFFDSVLNLDARTLRTLGPLLAKPGYLTLEYFRGHRVRYVSPVRLFFFLCIAAIFAVTLAFDFDTASMQTRSDALEKAQTVAEAERVRDEGVAALQEARAGIPDTPGARVGIDIGIQQVKEDAQSRIEWLGLRDQAIKDGKPIPEWEADNSRGINAGRMQFNEKPWDAKTNPVTVDWLSTQGNVWLNALIGRVQENAKAIEKRPRLLFDAFFGGLPQTLLVLLPLFALLLKIMYVFKRRLYMEHLIVALHSHAFLCAALLIMVAVYKLREALGDGFFHAALLWVEIAIWIWMPVYLFVLQKRVYRQGWILTSLKFCFLGLCYVVLLSIGAAVNFAVSLVAL